MHSTDLIDRRLHYSVPGRSRAETCSGVAAALRLVIARHRRLQRLLGMHAPEIVLRNEGRMLRAALGALTEIGRRAAGRQT